MLVYPVEGNKMSPLNLCIQKQQLKKGVSLINKIQGIEGFWDPYNDTEIPRLEEKEIIGFKLVFTGQSYTNNYQFL